MVVKTYAYKTFDNDREILADVHFNSDVSSSRFAIALAIHAGGFVLGKRDTIAPHWIDELQARNFVVVSIDYRLCPQVSLLEGPITDTRDAYRWCRDRLPELLSDDAKIEVDGSRIVALGWSAGGHLSMILGGEAIKPQAILNCYGPMFFLDPCYREPVDAIMPMIPRGPLVFDEVLMNKIYEEPVLTFSDNPIVFDPKTGELGVDFSQPRVAWNFGNISRGTWIRAIGSIEGQEEHVDPAMHIDEHFPPTFFLWGAHDQIIPPRLAQRAHNTLTLMGIETELVVAGDFGHAFGAGLQKGTKAYEDYVLTPVDFLARHAHGT